MEEEEEECGALFDLWVLLLRHFPFPTYRTEAEERKRLRKRRLSPSSPIRKNAKFVSVCLYMWEEMNDAPVPK